MRYFYILKIFVLIPFQGTELVGHLQEASVVITSFYTELLGGIPFQGPDGDGFIQISPSAGNLAGDSAAPTANGCQWIGSTCDKVGPFKITFSNSANISPCIRANRTTILALNLLLSIIKIGNFYS